MELQLLGLFWLTTWSLEGSSPRSGYADRSGKALKNAVGHSPCPLPGQ